MPVPQHRNYNVNPRHEICNKNLSASIGPKRQKITQNQELLTPRCEISIKDNGPGFLLTP